jgi:hypothetical protein
MEVNGNFGLLVSWGLCSHSFVLGWAYECFNQENMEEAATCPSGKFLQGH